ncbi:hypothetical protein AAFC00_001813 [Neodothiora populina]|uniref:Cystinosin n=1 Tax=Neodothiora populina TaxID=2781224 RepID=A0ABR3PR71_9PEZI
MHVSDIRTFARIISRLTIVTRASTISWSLSFYPQPILNWHLRSTAGFSFDFAALNVVGFFCYTVSTAAFLFSPTILRQYAQRYPLDPVPTVRFNDFVFALHALVLVLVVFTQFWHRLWRFHGRRDHLSAIIIGILGGSSLGVAIVAIIALEQRSRDDPYAWKGIDVIYALSYVKLLVTFIKYMPQALRNYRKKSTAGWAIHTIYMDLLGGVTSLMQLIIDSSLQSDWADGIKGNPVKFGLSLVSLAFDTIFMIQHYVLYAKNNDQVDDEQVEDGERTSLLR